MCMFFRCSWWTKSRIAWQPGTKHHMAGMRWRMLNAIEGWEGRCHSLSVFIPRGNPVTGGWLKWQVCGLWAWRRGKHWQRIQWQSLKGRDGNKSNWVSCWSTALVQWGRCRKETLMRRVIKGGFTEPWNSDSWREHNGELKNNIETLKKETWNRGNSCRVACEVDFF